jgi:PTH1 family peptidyl-tRNA hydrolase
MKLIVGLGNPGRKYKKTRHNVGFRVIDELKKSLDKARDKHVILLKPSTFMNNSGKEVKILTTKYKIPATNIIVIHDDIDLPFGTIRVSENISSAGHKGVQSIIDELGTQDFIRFRIGIRPRWDRRSQRGKKVDTERFVLEKFTKEEKKQLKEIIEKAIEEILNQIK